MHTSSPAAPSSPRDESAQAVKWVPDEEVNDCPICERKFGVSLRKHHCRLCGRVVCGGCSGNQIYVQGSKQRVCDPCCELQQHDKTALLAENRSHHKQAEAVLKANLKEKHENAQWFRDFLQIVVSETLVGDLEAADETETSNASPSSSATEAPVAQSSGDSSPISPGRAALLAMETKTRRRWTQVCDLRKKNEAELDKLLSESESLETELQTRNADAKQLADVVHGLSSELRQGQHIVSERDLMARKVATLSQELDGLTQRAQALQADRERNAVGAGSWSFVSALSSAGGNGLTGGLATPQEPRSCTDRCRSAGSGCALM